MIKILAGIENSTDFGIQEYNSGGLGLMDSGLLSFKN